MRKLVFAMLCAASVTAASPAFATATVSFNGGVGGVPAGETLYADFSPGNTGNPTGSGFQTQTISDGSGAIPAFGSTGAFFTVLAGGDALFTFADELSELGFDYGSADFYNTFTLTFADLSTQILTGTQIITSPPANGNQGSALTNGRVTFTTGSGSGITGLRIQSSQNSAEVDNFGIVKAVPEPATWAMMLLGFGGMGVALRRRRRNPGLAQIA